MAQYTCPRCGNSGNESTDETGAFEVRGKYEGKAVRMCRGCGVGLMIGPLSGGFVGQPKVIPDQLWGRMQSLWSENFSTDEESNEESPDFQSIADMLIEEARAWADVRTNFEQETKDSTRIEAVVLSLLPSLSDIGSDTLAIRDADITDELKPKLLFECIFLRIFAADFAMINEHHENADKLNELREVHMGLWLALSKEAIVDWRGAFSKRSDAYGQAIVTETDAPYAMKVGYVYNLHFGSEDPFESMEIIKLGAQIFHAALVSSLHVLRKTEACTRTIPSDKQPPTVTNVTPPTIICPNCERVLSKRATVCPSCSVPITN